MTDSAFTLSQDGPIAHLVLNRPKSANSMNLAFWRGLPSAIQALDEAGDTRVLIVSAEGKHFCSGMDLNIFANPKSIPMTGEPGRNAENLSRIVQQLQAAFTCLEKARFPVIAAIQGACIGGAIDMITACDMRYCTQEASFCVKETQMGMAPDLGTLQRLPRIIGEGRAREWVYTASTYSAEQAESAGLINDVFENHDEMMSTVQSIAERIALHSPLSVTGAKQMLNYSRDHGVDESLQMMSIWQAGMFRPEDLMRAMQAQMTKKAPAYKDLMPVEPVFSEA